MGGGADIAKAVVEDEVFEVDEFAIDPQRGAGVGKLGALEEAASDVVWQLTARICLNIFN